MSRVISIQGEVYRQLVNTTGQVMQATEETVPLNAVVAASMFIAEVKVNKMLQKASEDPDYRRRLVRALKRADKVELVKLSEQVRD